VASKLTRSEAAAIIEKFVADETDEYEWDDFTSVRYSDPLVESARRRCLAVHDEYPAPPGARRYCSEEGVIVLRSIAVALRAAMRELGR
jgi:hypothetical protein